MWSLKAYLKAKCADPAFLDRYHEECAICPKTVAIMTTIRERGLAFADVAQRAGVDIEHLQLLEAGERCDIEEVHRLGRCLDLAIAGDCRRESWRRSKTTESPMER
ncbi:MAG: hypothetical protein M0042_04700 [Nitrospiraceae bacterium]|nr:hypothetical protein [Nitrospiraceae bacterium]